MKNPATDATDNNLENTENNPADTAVVKTEKAESPDTDSQHEPAMDQSVVKAPLSPKELKTINAISWLSLTMAFLPLIVLIVVADGYDSIQRFNPTDSLFFPVVMFAITYIGSVYAKKANNFVTKALNALFGTFYIFLFMLYLASGIVGLNAVLIIPLILPVVLPVVFIWMLGVKVTLSKLHHHPVDEEGNPIDPNLIDPLKETLPDKTFAEIVFQIMGVFLAIFLGYFITTGIISLL